MKYATAHINGARQHYYISGPIKNDKTTKMSDEFWTNNNELTIGRRFFHASRW